MATGASPNALKYNFLNAYLTGKTVKCLLASNAFTPNIDSTNFRSNITNEITGTGYTSGGVTVTATASLDLTADKGILTFGAASFGTVTIANIKHYIYYVDTGTAGTSEVLGWVTLAAGEEQAPGNISFSVPSNTISIG
jgi:hypothetical protein